MNGTLLHLNRTEELDDSSWLAKIESLGFKGVIFDCDGTLVESGDAHLRSMQTAAMKQGHRMTSDWYLSRTGLDRDNLFRHFRADKRPEFDVTLACRDSIIAFASNAALVRPIAPTIRLFRDLRSRGVPVAVATNAEREVAIQSLQAVGLEDEVDILVSISEELAPKPSPDLFLSAANRMQLNPVGLLVVEDSPQGTEAGMTAGMAVLLLAHTGPLTRD